MTFDDYWEKLETKNSELKQGSTEMSISVGSFRKVMRHAFNAGVLSNTASTESAARDFGGVGKPSNPFDGIFGDLFGTRR